MQPPRPDDALFRSAMLWHSVARACLLLTGAAFGGALVSGATPCGSGLDVVEAPVGWQALPPAARGEHLVIKTQPLRLKYITQHEEAEIYDPALCRDGGLSLQSWFDAQVFPTDIRHPEQLVIHHDASSGIFVVGGTKEHPATADAEKETVVTAFRRSHRPRIGWRSPIRAALAIAALLALVIAARGVRLCAARLQGASPEAPEPLSLEAAGRLAASARGVARDTVLATVVIFVVAGLYAALLALGDQMHGYY